MIRNYLLVALRALNRQRVNAMINLVGLSMGMACSIAIMLYVYAEWSYDRHYKGAERIYKVGISFFNIGNFAIGPEALGTYLPNEFEGIESFTRIYNDPELPVQIGDKLHTEAAYFTDFSYEFVSGNALTALKAPASLVLTREMARKLFRTDDPVGKTLLVGKDKLLFTVTGVVKDDERSSQLKSKIWLSNESKLKNEPVWTSAGSYNYLKLRPNLTEDDLAAALDRLLEKEVYPHASGVPQGLSFEEYRKHENSVKFIIQPLRSVHLYSKLNYEISPTGNPENLTIFSAVSIIILLLAAINFINLATAQGAQRAKEIGVRKTMGASPSRLILQFVLESVVTCLIALPVSLILCEAILQLFGQIAGEQLVSGSWLSFSVLIALVLFVVVLGILAGIYPAFILTSLKPVWVLKGHGASIKSGRLRDILVSTQLAISVGLTIVTLTVIRQLNYMKVKDLGFNQEQVMIVDQINLLKGQQESLKQSLQSLSGVGRASLYTGEPGNKSIMSFNTFKTPEMEDAITINSYFGDDDFVSVMGFRLLQE